MGVPDLSGTIIAGVQPDQVADNDNIRDYLDSLDFQLGF